MLAPLTTNLQRKGGIFMALFFLTRNAAAFTPGVARSISIARSAPTISSVGKLFMSTSNDLSPDQVADIELKIQNKGDEIRKLKEDGIEKADLAPYIQELLALKAQIAPPEVKRRRKNPKNRRNKSNPQRRRKKICQSQN